MKNDEIRKEGETLSAPASSEDSAAVTPKKRKFGRKVLIKIMFVVSVILIMISLSVSWFHHSNTAIGDGISLQVVDPNNLADITGKEPYVRGTLNSVVGDGKEFFKPVWEKVAVENDGNDMYNFYKNQLTDLTKLTEDVTKPDADEVKSVFVEDFKFSIDGAFDMYLGAGSNVEPNPDEEEGSAAFNVQYDKYKYVKSVARVAILKLNDAGTAYELKAVWVPSVYDKNGNLEDSFKVVYTDNGGKVVERIVWTKGEDKGSGEVNGITYYWGELGGDNRVALGEINNTATYRCAVWLDGYDVDCTNDLCEQRIKATFKFTPVEKAAVATAE